MVYLSNFQCPQIASCLPTVRYCWTEEELEPRIPNSIRVTEITQSCLSLFINQSKSTKLNFIAEPNTTVDHTHKEILKPPLSTNFLRITIDKNLTWKTDLTMKLSTALYGMKRIRAIAGEMESVLRLGKGAWGVMWRYKSLCIDLPYNRRKKYQNHPDYTGSKSFPQYIKVTQASTLNTFNK